MFNHEKINYLIAEKQKEDKTITIVTIANEIGIHIDTLNKVKAGKSKPTFEILEKIAIYFKVSMDSFSDNSLLKEYSIIDNNKSIVSDHEGNNYSKKTTAQNPWELLHEADKKIIELTEKCADMSVENERLKNANAPVKDALAG